jgi:hypothetical protein
MRRMLAIVAIAGCGGKKEPPKQEQPVPVVTDAALPVDAARGPVELLHAYRGFVEVSSHVMNKTIKPEHLVDGDRETAWNSRTGELVGAWLDVWVPNGTIEELRLTVGHTGTGPKGEDYFGLNPRIKAVSLLDGDKVIKKVTLDPENRELQTIKLPAPLARVRVRIEDVKLGGKKAWREVCISELEAWAQPGTAMIAVPAASGIYDVRLEIAKGPACDTAWQTPGNSHTIAKICVP